MGLVVALLAIGAFLAFGVFGIQTAFIDDEVSEANPFATVDAGMAERFDDMEAQMASGSIVVEAVVGSITPTAAKARSTPSPTVSRRSFGLKMTSPSTTDQI